MSAADLHQFMQQVVGGLYKFQIEESKAMGCWILTVARDHSLQSKRSMGDSRERWRRLRKPLSRRELQGRVDYAGVVLSIQRNRGHSRLNVDHHGPRGGAKGSGACHQVGGTENTEHQHHSVRLAGVAAPPAGVGAGLIGRSRYGRLSSIPFKVRPAGALDARIPLRSCAGDGPGGDLYPGSPGPADRPSDLFAGLVPPMEPFLMSWGIVLQHVREHRARYISLTIQIGSTSGWAQTPP